MSSNQSNDRKVTSITRKLEWLIARKKLFIAFFSWIGLIILLSALWCVCAEITALGKFDINNIRVITGLSRFSTIEYIVKSRSGEVLLSQNLYLAINYIFVICTGIYIVRILGALFGMLFDSGKIKTILKPINEIARKADEFSKIEFSEDKYQILEDALSKIEPEDNDVISLPDEELQGIEQAMNNLIARIRDNYRQQARFVNDASHELRTPIAVIEGYANMLARWGREDEKVLDESITAIKNESAHMKHLVEQLLFLARGDSGKTVLNKENVIINDLMREIYEESLMIDEEHPYRFSAPENSLMASIDQGLIKQAVRILIDNAVKYTKKGDEILLSVGLTDENCPYLQVQDTGIGMCESDVEHMFERFYRADQARNTEGTGLGLSIAKWIVDKHHGYFSIVSRTDLGTRIRIILPAESIVSNPL